MNQRYDWIRGIKVSLSSLFSIGIIAVIVLLQFTMHIVTLNSNTLFKFAFEFSFDENFFLLLNVTFVDVIHLYVHHYIFTFFLLRQ